jgi:hypothetical protein
MPESRHTRKKRDAQAASTVDPETNTLRRQKEQAAKWLRNRGLSGSMSERVADWVVPAWAHRQRIVLVLLGALLMVAFATPGSWFQGEAPDVIRGTLDGVEVSERERVAFRDRWYRLRLGSIFGPNVINDTAMFYTYLVYLAAVEDGVEVGPAAVREAMRREPAFEQRVEYVLAAPSKLGETIEPGDDELRRFHRTHPILSKDKFEDRRDAVLREYRNERASALARQRINRAAALILDTPRSGEPWRRALREAASKTGLEYELPLRSFPRQFARVALRDLTDRQGELPEEIDKALFEQLEVGVPSKVFQIGDRLAICRVVEWTAGYTDQGELFLEDKGWRGNQFGTTRKFESYQDLVRDKLRMGPEQVARTFEEYLVVQKYLVQFCGPDGPALMTEDAHKQIANLLTERVRGLTGRIPVEPFLQPDEPADPHRVAAFYNARKSRLADQADLRFNYFQPEQIELEIIAAPISAYEKTVTVSPEEVGAYYERHKETKFAGPEGKVKPFEMVRIEARNAVRRAKAEDAARQALSVVRRRAQDRRRAAVESAVLQRVAEDAGFLYRKTKPFTQEEALSVLRSFADAEGNLPEDLVARAFSEDMRPSQVPISPEERVLIRPLSPNHVAGDQLFFYRVLRYHRGREVNFSELEPEKQKTVEDDWRRYQAMRRASQAGEKARVGIARRLLTNLAGESGVAVHQAVVPQSAGEAPTGDVPVPEAVVARVREKMERRPGELAAVVRGDDALYTIAITSVDSNADKTTIEYLGLKDAQLAAPPIPGEEIEAAARDLLGAEKKANDAKKDGEKETLPDEPTAKHRKRAKEQLLSAWKQRPFAARYFEHVKNRMSEAFTDYLADHPLLFDAREKLRRFVSPRFFHLDDSFPFRGDAGLIKAAFRLKRGELSPAVSGDESAALILLEDEATRTERKFEIITVQPGEYPPLSVTVGDDEAKAEYEKNKDAFALPARVEAEFLFADRAAVARDLAPTISEEAVQKHFQANRESLFKGQQLDASLQKRIRKVLAQQQVKAEKRARSLVTKAAERAQAEPKRSLPDIEFAMRPVALTAGTTGLLGPEDEKIEGIGYAPALVKQIREAKVGVLSPPVEVQNPPGWVLFRVTGRLERTVPALKDALPAARAAIRDRKLSARARAALGALRDAVAKGEAKTIEDAIDAPELTRELPGTPIHFTTGFLDTKAAENYVGLAEGLRKVLFQTPVGKVTAIFELDNKLQFVRVAEEQKNRVVKAHYVPVAASLFDHQVKLTDEDVLKHFEAHRADYKLPLRYEVEVLTVRSRQLEDTFTPTEEELEAAYRQLRNRFRIKPETKDNPRIRYKPLTEVRQTVANVLKRQKADQEARDLAARLRAEAVDKKTSFADLAKAHAAAVGHTEAATLTADGDRGPYHLRETPGLKAFLTSAKEKTVSDVLPSLEGPIVVRLKEILPASDAEFETVKPKVKADARRVGSLEKARLTAEEFRKQIVAELTLPEPTKIKPEEVDARIIAPTLRRIDTVLETFTVATKKSVPIVVKPTSGITRLQSWPECWALGPRLIEMPFCQITPKPVFNGEKADAGYLAILLEAGEGSLDWQAFQLRQRWPRDIRDSRRDELVESIRQRFRPARPPES